MKANRLTSVYMTSGSTSAIYRDARATSLPGMWKQGLRSDVEEEAEPVPPVPVSNQNPLSLTQLPERTVLPVPIPAEPEEPQPEAEELTIYVSPSVGEGGLRLREKPSAGGAVVAVEKAWTAFTLSPNQPKKSGTKSVKKAGKWIHVSDPKRLSRLRVREIR